MIIEAKLKEILKRHCKENMVVLTSNESETVINAMKEACGLYRDTSPTYYDKRTMVKDTGTKRT